MTTRREASIRKTQGPRVKRMAGTGGFSFCFVLIGGQPLLGGWDRGVNVDRGGMSNQYEVDVVFCFAFDGNTR